LPAEVKQCNEFLRNELQGSPEVRVVLALGLIAHQAVLRACDMKQGQFRFAHGAEHALGEGRRLLDSYHCSRYNTQTRRLTAPMFQSVVARARDLL
jgi:uracil-DNA glycosylase